MVAVLVLDALQDVALRKKTYISKIRKNNKSKSCSHLELLNDCLLLFRRDRLERLLDDPAAVHLERQRLDVGPELRERKKQTMSKVKPSLSLSERPTDGRERTPFEVSARKSLATTSPYHTYLPTYIGTIVGRGYIGRGRRMKTLSTLHYPLQRRGKGRNKKPFQLEWPIQIRPPGLRFENPSIPSLLPFKMQHPSEPEKEKGKKWRRRKERHFTGACMGKRGGRVGVRRERGGKGALQRGGGGGGEKFANSAQETHLRSQRAGEGEKGEALESSSKREAGGRDRDGYKCSFPSSLHRRSGGEVGEAHASNDEEERREGGGDR